MSNLDASNFTYIWHHPDLNMEILWSGINDLVRESYKLDSSYYDTFIEIEKFAYELAGKDMSFSKFVTQRRPIPAGLTDSWFC